MDSGKRAEERIPSFSPQTLGRRPAVADFHLKAVGAAASLHHPPYPSIFTCPSFSPSLCWLPSSPSLSLSVFALSFPPPPTCGFALQPSVLFPSLSSSSVIPRSHMVSLSGSVCVWCYPEFSGAPCSYGCVFCRRRERDGVYVCVCVCRRVCVCRVQQVMQQLRLWVISRAFALLLVHLFPSFLCLFTLNGVPRSADIQQQAADRSACKSPGLCSAAPPTLRPKSPMLQPVALPKSPAGGFSCSGGTRYMGVCLGVLKGK